MDNVEKVNELKKCFPVDAHEVRKGYWVSGNNYRYFVYIKREKIIERLDNLFPMTWSSELSKPRVVTCCDESGIPYNVVTVSSTIIIDGIIRSFNGSDVDTAIYRGKGNERKIVAYDPKNTEKSAATDSFKRAAQQFGIGLYLYEDGPKIVAGSKEEAWTQFTKWYQGTNASNEDNSQTKPGHDSPTGSKRQSGKPFTGEKISNFVEHFMYRFEGSNHVRDVFASLKVNNLHEISGDYATAIKKTVETAYNNGLPVRVEYVQYVVNGDSKYLVFCADPSSVVHKNIRAYGRSTTVKNSLNGLRNGLYESLALDQLANANKGFTTDWYPLDTHLLVDYEVKDGYFLASGFRLPEGEIDFTGE